MGWDEMGEHNKNHGIVKFTFYHGGDKCDMIFKKKVSSVLEVNKPYKNTKALELSIEIRKKHRKWSRVGYRKK